MRRRLLGPILPDRLRATRALRWFLGTFLATQIALGFVVDAHPDLRFPWRATLAARVREAGRAPDVLLLGSSRTMPLFPAPESPSRPPAPPAPWVLNASAPACAAPCLEPLLHAALGAASAPKLAILEVSPELVGLASPWLGHDLIRVATWRDVPGTLSALVPSQAVMALLSSRFDTAYRHRELLLEVGFGRFADDARRLAPPGGAAPAPPTAAPEDATRIGTRAFRKWLRRYRTGGPSVAALRRMLEACRRARVETILYTPPLTRAHREVYTPAIEAAYRELLEGLAGTYGCRLLDWRTRYPDSAFRDNHHLHAAAALAVTDDFRREVVDPALGASR